jgi:hypothetical protein
MQMSRYPTLLAIQSVREVMEHGQMAGGSTESAPLPNVGSPEGALRHDGGLAAPSRDWRPRDITRYTGGLPLKCALLRHEADVAGYKLDLFDADCGFSG